MQLKQSVFVMRVLNEMVNFRLCYVRMWASGVPIIVLMIDCVMFMLCCASQLILFYVFLC